MTQETIVAAFDTVAPAEAAARALEAAGVPAADITQHVSDPATSTTTTNVDAVPARKEGGFWAKLFGTEDDDYAHGTATARDHAVYDRTMAGGGTVLSIRILNVEQDADRVLDILEGHNPIDIEERASSQADLTTGYAATTGVAPAAAVGSQTIQLAEEALVVGKRVVNRGTTRIRRYVVETPVSEDVSLHQENVSIERRPVTGSTVGADAFTDKTVEVTEMNEEAVVGKTARVVEEVVVHKDASDRVETVRDTVRREEIEVDKVVDDRAGSAAGSTPKL